MSEANPFEAGAGGVRRGPPTPSAVLRAFAVQRGFRLLVLPALLGVVTLFARQDLDLPAWSVILVSAGSAVLWLPTSLWMAWARFLRPPQDDQALLLTSGERLDRVAFRHLVAARSVEVLLLIGGLVAISALFVARFGWLGSPVIAVGLAMTVWTALLLRAQWFVATASIRLAEGRPEAVLDALERTRVARLRRATRDVLDGLAAAALTALGRGDAALEAIARVRDPRRTHLDLLEAQIRTGRGERPPDAIIEEAGGTLARRLARAELVAIAAIEDRDLPRLHGVLQEWSPRALDLPRRHRQTWLLLEAALHALRGDALARRAALERAEIHPDALVRRARVFPTWLHLAAGPELHVADLTRNRSSQEA